MNAQNANTQIDFELALLDGGILNASFSFAIDEMKEYGLIKDNQLSFDADKLANFIHAAAYNQLDCSSDLESEHYQILDRWYALAYGTGAQGSGREELVEEETILHFSQTV